MRPRPYASARVRCTNVTRSALVALASPLIVEEALSSDRTTRYSRARISTCTRARIYSSTASPCGCVLARSAGLYWRPGRSDFGDQQWCARDHQVDRDLFFPLGRAAVVRTVCATPRSRCRRASSRRSRPVCKPAIRSRHVGSPARRTSLSVCSSKSAASQIIPNAFGEKAELKLMFGAKVTMFERRQLTNLRKKLDQEHDAEFGIDAKPLKDVADRKIPSTVRA